MRKMILLAALTATIAPSTAIAQQHDWHHDRDGRHDREDRRDWRHHQRARYIAPYRNWNYRPVTVGFRLEPAFYGSRYYINDYGSYRLRAPGRWQRWIRYGDDLLLVNVRTGRVGQVIHYRHW